MRTIIRDELFEADAKSIVESGNEKVEEFLEAVEMVLSRKPECGYPLSNSHVWFIAGHTVSLVLYYTFDDNNVYLLSMQKTEILET